jgi:hypothetical protein
MTQKDVEIVEVPYPDDWYNDPKMVGPPIENLSELWLKRDHKHAAARIRAKIASRICVGSP